MAAVVELARCPVLCQGCGGKMVPDVSTAAQHEGWGRPWNTCLYDCVACRGPLASHERCLVCRACRVFQHSQCQALADPALRGAAAGRWPAWPGHLPTPQRWPRQRAPAAPQRPPAAAPTSAGAAEAPGRAWEPEGVLEECPACRGRGRARPAGGPQRGRPCGSCGGSGCRAGPWQLCRAPGGAVPEPEAAAAPEDPWPAAAAAAPARRARRRPAAAAPGGRAEVRLPDGWTEVAQELLDGAWVLCEGGAAAPGEV